MGRGAVIAGLDPALHASVTRRPPDARRVRAFDSGDRQSMRSTAWMAGPSPAMTVVLGGGDLG